MKLIMINGPTGVGKTTLAKKLHEVMPMSFLIDLDEQRRFISHYREYKKESGKLSFDVALAILEVCMKNGYDYIIGKGILAAGPYIHDKNLIEKFAKIGKKYKAEIYEIFLWADKEVTYKRMQKRGFKHKPNTPRDKLNENYKLEEITKDKRTKAFVIDSNDLTANEVFKKACGIVEISNK